MQVTLVEVAGFRGRRQVTVLPFIGHGSPELVHVRARVVLGSKAARDAATTVVVSDEPAPAGDGADATTAPEPGTGDGTGAGGDVRAGADVRAGDGRAARADGTLDAAGSAGTPGAAGTTGAGGTGEAASTAGTANAGSTAGAADPAGTAGPRGAAGTAGDGGAGAGGGGGRSARTAVAGGRGGRRAERRSASARLGTWRTLRESLTPFFTVELPRIRVTVRAPAGATVVRCDRQGYLDVAVDGAGLTPGWQELTVAASRRGHSTEMAVPVLIVDPEATLALVSDLDDTVIETGLTRGLEFLRLTLLTSVTDRTPLPGAAELYRALTAPRAGTAGCPVFYLSTSPWNLYELLARFMVLRGFPTGPLMLTDWGPSRTNWFRVTAEEHKLTMIRTLLSEHPALQVVLIGDTGQLDPEIYATVAVESPDRVRAVYVRRTPSISPARAVEVDALARRAAAAGVPMVAVEDSVDIARHAAGLGLLDAADVGAVSAATRH